MVLALEFFFDTAGEKSVRGLWQALEEVGVPSLGTKSHRGHRPHLTFAVGTALPDQTRNELTRQLALLSLPAIWLSTLSVLPAKNNAAHLALTPVVDTELLAVHSAVHDVLAGKFKNQSAYCLPGSWIPHCTLSQELDSTALTGGISALHPVRPIRADLGEVALIDTTARTTDVLLPG